jgi:hypothetical protein
MSAPRATPSALAVSSDREKAAVLDELVSADPELTGRAERAARCRLAEADTDDVASAVAAALLTLDQEDLAAHAGRTRYGYVESTEAAWSLLESAVEPWLQDIERRASLGLTEAARRLGLGILEALRRIDRHIGNDDLLLSWAPDLPGETADRVIELLNAPGLKPTEAELAHVSATEVGRR